MLFLNYFLTNKIYSLGHTINHAVKLKSIIYGKDLNYR